MNATRIGFLTLLTSAAIGVALCCTGPGFARGGGGGGGGGGGSGAAKPKAKTVLDEIEADTSLTKFVAALKAAGLDATLKGAGPFTVLAPNDAAFGKVDAKWTELAKDKAKLKTILQGHILSSKMKAADIGKATKLSAMGGVTHEVKLGDDKQPMIAGAKIVQSDKEGSNGLLQIIDSVLMPPEKAAAPAPAPAPAGGK